MEENKIQDVESKVTESQSEPPQVATENNVEPQAQEPKAEEVAEPQTAPHSEPQAAPQTPLAPPVMVQPRRSGGIFLKVFLASLLALVAFAIVKIFFWGAIIASLFAEEPIEVPESAILRIDMKEAIADAPSRNPMGNFDIMTMSIAPQMTLLNALTAIDAAKSDPRIKAIYINTTGMGGASIAALEELREAIVAFRESGKLVVAYNNVYDQASYFLASAADEVFIHPEGTFNWIGLSLNTMFYTGLIEKLGVEIDILRPTVCRYKSAVEPFFLKKLSAENREQMQTMADDIWEVILGAVSESRGIEPAQLNAYADNLAAILPQEAVEIGMVDGVKYADQMEAYFQAKLGVVADDAMISLGTYAQTVSLKSDDPAKQIAIIYANGNVVDGNGPEDAVYGDALAALLKEAREDEAIKAVVVRVNSPGGSALASDIIWREMTLLQQQKPVVVSMGEYAASGGYYISAPADAIIANRTTLTGSIGVFGILPSLGNALEQNLGITLDGVKTNQSSAMGSGFEPLSKTEHKAMMRSVDRVYERFTSLVAEGRNLTIEQVYDIAEGRVWTGKRAVEIGLADMNGGLYTAIGYAASVANLGTSYQVVELTDVDFALAAMMGSLSADVEQSLYNTLPAAEAVKDMWHAKQMLTEGGVYTLCPLSIEIK
ncbi:MAG: signal peptide peptidase SppA [Alistipes sp.]|nr:signal peptide peptidase SppA [Alistipes sp.]